MAGTFGAGESLTSDLNDGILARVALTPLSPYRIVFEILAVNAVLDLVQLLARAPDRLRPAPRTASCGCSRPPSPYSRRSSRRTASGCL